MLVAADAGPATSVGHLWLTDFRCLRDIDVELASGLTVLQGANGQGKTSLLEAIGWIARARSFRGVTDAMLVLTTLPNADAAAELAKSVVTEKLAACANLFPALRSIYKWQTKVQDENEVLVLFKTRQEHFERLKSRILELHPYEVPEVLAIPVEQGYDAYLDWIARETS